MHGKDVCVFSAWMCYDVLGWCVFSPVWRNIKIREPVKSKAVVYCLCVDVRLESGGRPRRYAVLRKWVVAADQHPAPERPLTLRVVGCLPSTAGLSVYARTQRAGVLQALKEETAGRMPRGLGRPLCYGDWSFDFPVRDGEDTRERVVQVHCRVGCIAIAAVFPLPARAKEGNLMPSAKRCPDRI